MTAALRSFNRNVPALALLFALQVVVLLLLPASAGGWVGALLVSAGLTALHVDLCHWLASAGQPSQFGEPWRLFQEVVLRADDAVVIIGGSPADEGGRPIEFVNAAFERMTGYCAAEVVGRPLNVLRGPDTDPEQLEPIRVAFRDGAPGRTTIQNARKDGSLFWAEQVYFPLREPGQPIAHWAFVLRDMTERVQSEQALARAKESAEASNRAKDEFLANISHELRTPLAAIIGFAELLLAESVQSDDQPTHNYVKSIHRNARHLLQIINDILDLSQIEAGRLRLSMTRCSPIKLVHDVLSAQQVEAERKGLQLDVECAADVPTEMQTDPTRVRQILLNFLSNAVKFTVEGRIVLRVEGDQTGGVRFEVQDEGIGMSAAQMANLFQPFQQGDGSMSRRYGGTGLGLSISKRLALALGGDLEVRSQLDCGSTFTLRLPASETSLATPPPSSGHLQPAPILSGRVLLAEDGKDNQLILTHQLRAAGLFVGLAENGQEAVEKALSDEYDLILMDMQMPVMDGYAATEELRRQGYAGPIIAVTAHAMPGDDEKCRRVGCTDYLAKPVEVDVMIAALARYLAPVAEPTQAEPIPQSEDMRNDYQQRLTLRLDELRAAIQAGDAATVSRLAHQTAGSAGMYGLDDLGETAWLLEQAAVEGQDHTLLSELVEEMARRVEVA